MFLAATLSCVRNVVTVDSNMSFKRSKCVFKFCLKFILCLFLSFQRKDNGADRTIPPLVSPPSPLFNPTSTTPAVPSPPLPLSLTLHQLLSLLCSHVLLVFFHLFPVVKTVPCKSTDNSTGRPHVSPPCPLLPPLPTPAFPHPQWHYVLPN